MANLKRRAAIKLFTAIGALFPLGVLLESSQSPPPPSQRPLPPEKLARLFVMILNTVEGMTFKSSRLYLLQDELLASAAFSQAAMEVGLTQFLVSSTAGDVLPPYRLRLQLKPSMMGYDLLLVNMGTGSAFRTNEQGVILTGSSVGADGHPSIDFADFHGVALNKPIAKAETRGPFMAALASVAGFFLPTLNAACPPCCECWSFCEGPGPCAEMCPAICCNVGFANCTWCCKDPGSPYSCLCCILNCIDP